MFTLITLLVLALLAGATFTVKKLLNKKRENIQHIRKEYTPEVLDKLNKVSKHKTRVDDLTMMRDNMTKSTKDKVSNIVNHDEPTFAIGFLKLKKLGKSKYKRSFNDYKVVMRFV